MTFDDAIDRLYKQFDAERSTIEAVVNDRHARMVADARWRQSQSQIATTVAGEQTYALPVDLVHLSDVKVGGAVYEWAPEADVWRLSAGDTGLWFSVLDDENGTPTLALNPVPAENGLAVTALATLGAPVLAYGTGGTFVIPTDLHGNLLAGARSDLFREADERPDLAQVEEQFYDQGVAKLRARRYSLVGPRVTRIRVAGRDF